VLLLFCVEACNGGENSLEPDGDSDISELESDGYISSDEDEDVITDGDTDAEESLNRVEFTIDSETLKIDLSFENKLLTSIFEEGRSPFYIVSNEERHDLVGPYAVSEIEDGQLVTCKTHDGRDASIKLTAGPEASLEIRFNVTDAKVDEEWGVSFNVTEDEGFYGLMERVVQGPQDLSWREGMSEALDLRGQEVELYVLPTVSIYSPFYVSSVAYGVHVLSDWPGVYRFGSEKADKVSIEYSGPELALRILPGPTPLDVTARYSRASGLALMPPRWAFGPWRWRDEHFNLDAFFDGTTYDGPYNSMLVEDILMMEALGIPCTLYWVDRPWCPGSFGFDDLTWDEERLPQPLDLLDWLDSRNVKFMLWIAPWAMGEMALEAETLGYAVVNQNPTDPFNAKLLDLSNPEAVAWWQDHLMERINEGVAGFKLDRGDEKVPDGVIFSGTYSDGTDYRPGRNKYPYWYAKAVQGAFERAGVEEYTVMPRAGWVGSQQHAIFWGGDTHDDQWGLRSGIIALQRAAVMNYPVWGTDTCGYGMSGREVCARWLAFSAFSPLMEVGPTRNASLWSMLPEGESGGVGEDGYSYTPYYDAELLAIWHFYANLHYDLMDYSQAQAEKATSDGTPFVRPMIFMHPDQSQYRDYFDQYYYGPDIIVAPVWEEGKTERDVLLPEGDWVDAWTGQAAASSSDMNVAVPLHKMPIYYRAGSDVAAVFSDLEQRWADAQTATASPPDLAELVADMK